MTQYRADHIGSLLRPQALLDARAAHAAGRLSLDALRQAEDEAILKVLELQRQAGMKIFSDGEFRRMSWVSGLPDALNGVRKVARRTMPSGTWKGLGADEANSELPIDKLEIIAAKTNRFKILEGGPAEAVVILRFPTWDDALEWYDSDEYQEARAHRLRGADTRAALVEGVDAPSAG